IFPPNLVTNVTASSNLEPKSLRYQAPNISDNNINTAWVEGIAGSGINEWIQIDITPTGAGGKIEGCYNLTKIGFVNGYSKDTITYASNNRIKTLKIHYQYYYNEGVFEGEKEFVINLKDQMKIQYINFEKPIKVSNITFTIIGVYKGNKFDDTCISEIILHTDN
ncbi:MAG: discoidin domain-containing protein, partial [Bacteroidota bacterium]